MKTSIISTIVATLLAASSAAPVDTEVATITYFGPNEVYINQNFTVDGTKYRISKFSFFLSFYYTSVQKDREF
jgi:hypothetical protein